MIWFVDEVYPVKRGDGAENIERTMQLVFFHLYETVAKTGQKAISAGSNHEFTKTGFDVPICGLHANKKI